MKRFINKHLEASGVTVTDVAPQFHDGVYLIILTGTLANFFVPLNQFTMSPTTAEQKVHSYLKIIINL